MNGRYLRTVPRGKRLVDDDGNKLCTACSERKPLSEFHKHTKSPDGYKGQCKQCRREKRTVPREELPDGMKRCAGCELVKALDEFHPSRSSGDRRQSHCKACANTGAKQRDSKLRSKYGISHADYERMLASQGGICALCGTDNPKSKNGKHFYVDHCHASGAVRGLLCVNCNLLLGYAQDDEARLFAAIEYLRKSKDGLVA